MIFDFQIGCIREEAALALRQDLDVVPAVMHAHAHLSTITKYAEIGLARLKMVGDFVHLGVIPFLGSDSTFEPI